MSSCLTAEGEAHDQFKTVARAGMRAGVGRNRANEVLKLKEAVNRQRKETAGPDWKKSFRAMSKLLGQPSISETPSPGDKTLVLRNPSAKACPETVMLVAAKS